MSVIIKGQTNLTSLSGGFSDITLGNPVPIVDQISFNNEIIEGDAEYNFGFKKGQDRSIFDYKFTLQTDATKLAMRIWLQKLGGDLNWFTLQPQGMVLPNEITCSSGGSTTTLKAVIGQATDYWIGWWVMFSSGPCYTALIRRKITGFTSGNPATITVAPAMSLTPGTSDKFFFGYPVRLDMQRVQFAQRMPSFWDFVLSMKEEPVD